jgi:hypothetical protein
VLPRLKLKGTFWRLNIFQISEVYVHPKLDLDSFKNNLAVLRLKSSQVAERHGGRPICLWNMELENSTDNATVIISIFLNTIEVQHEMNSTVSCKKAHG